MSGTVTRGRGGVKKARNLADVICEWPPCAPLARYWMIGGAAERGRQTGDSVTEFCRLYSHVEIELEP